MLTHCLAPGVEKQRAHFQGDTGPGFHVDCLWAKRDTNKEMKQTSALDPGALSLQKALFLLVFPEAKEGISKQMSISPLQSFMTWPQRFTQLTSVLMLRPLIDLPKQRKLNTRQCLYKNSKVRWETSHQLQVQKETSSRLSSPVSHVLERGSGAGWGAFQAQPLTGLFSGKLRHSVPIWNVGEEKVK